MKICVHIHGIKLICSRQSLLYHIGHTVLFCTPVNWYYKSSALFVQSCGNLHWRFVCMTLVQSKLIKWIPSRPNDSNQSRANVVSHFCFYCHRKWNITRYFWGFTTHAFEMLPAAVLMLFTNFIQDTDDCTKITSSFSTGHGLPILSTQAN